METKECIACAEEIALKAKLCKHCGILQNDERFANGGERSPDLSPEIDNFKIDKARTPKMRVPEIETDPSLPLCMECKKSQVEYKGLYRCASCRGGLALNVSNTVKPSQSDDEVLALIDPFEFVWWKKNKRPEIVVLDNGQVLLRAQFDFLKLHGYEMSEEIRDLWLAQGQPSIEDWDPKQAQLKKMRKTARTQKGLAALSVASAIFSAAGKLIQDAGTQANTPRQQGQCSRCGSPMYGFVCRYCQGQRA